jgi:hypothetical protein
VLHKLQGGCKSLARVTIQTCVPSERSVSNGPTPAIFQQVGGLGINARGTGQPNSARRNSKAKADGKPVERRAIRSVPEALPLASSPRSYRAQATSQASRSFSQTVPQLTIIQEARNLGWPSGGPESTRTPSAALIRPPGRQLTAGTPTVKSEATPPARLEVMVSCPAAPSVLPMAAALPPFHGATGSSGPQKSRSAICIISSFADADPSLLTMKCTTVTKMPSMALWN